MPANACAAAKTLFFSEAAEGSGSNKFLEIHNPTDAAIDLGGFAYPNTNNGATTNGKHEFWNTFGRVCRTQNCRDKKIKAKGVYVICDKDAASTITDKCDETHEYLSNGDDGFCLVKVTKAPTQDKGADAEYDKIDCTITRYASALMYVLTACDSTS